MGAEQIGDFRCKFSRQFFFFTRHGDQNGRSLERWLFISVLK